MLKPRLTGQIDTPAQVLAYAKGLGIEFRVPKDKDMLIAVSPWGSPLPRDLVKGIKEHKDVLMRAVLLEQALDYLNERYVKGADASAWDEPSERIDKYHSTDQPLELYRQAIRDYVTAAMAEFKRVKNEKKL